MCLFKSFNLSERLAYNGYGFVIGTTDAIRRHEQKPGKELKIQTTTDDWQRSVGLTTEDEKRTEVVADRGQPC